ncbi:MAG: hypothetical protein KGL51_10825 [Betaproteobacteria bacterium]|nr:hypothetical protein [Betaproteobacteria bacterium]MDE2124316.1 hypothetical protein [Betaproteobacteria bacterium]MDE2186217.1 hypothetical protein [Betaproteobacteria bacterium]MDE2325143.1 hypothetical protein [Betaproteobacteria bacterium]
MNDELHVLFGAGQVGQSLAQRLLAAGKGEVRAQVAELLFAAHRRGEVQATVGRASDFYGPGGAATFVGDHFWPAALAGKTVRLPFDPDAVHTYHYIPDVAADEAASATVAWARQH